MHLRFSTQALQIKETHFSARQFIIEHFFKRERGREAEREKERESTEAPVGTGKKMMAGLYF